MNKKFQSLLLYFIGWAIISFFVYRHGFVSDFVTFAWPIFFVWGLLGLLPIFNKLRSISVIALSLGLFFLSAAITGYIACKLLRSCELEIMFAIFALMAACAVGVLEFIRILIQSRKNR